MEDVRLEGKTAIVTGASSGIGVETARELARRGARVILACRDQSKAEAARDDIINSSRNNDIIIKIVDLASLRSIKGFAEDINQSESRLDLLVNNAGLLSKDRRETEDGFELTFGVNYLGHFYLTNLLLDKLKASAPSRIVNVSSMAHRWGKMNFNDLQLKSSYSAIKAYGQSKTGNILFTCHLAEILKETGVTAYALHPGVIETGMMRDYGENSWASCFNRIAVYLSGQRYKTLQEGAMTSLLCCLDPALARDSGKYYMDSKEKSASSHATDPLVALKLWEISSQLCQISN